MDPDPIVLIVSAVAAGAAAGLKDTAAQSIRDAYETLQQRIASRYGVDVTPVEQRPESGEPRRALETGLRQAAAERDDELLVAGQTVIKAVLDEASGIGEVIGVDLERLHAEFVRIRDVESSGPGVRIRDTKVDRHVDISGIRAGPRGS